MKSKYAIGISLNGNNVKAAFLSLTKGKVQILGLQSNTLAAPLENSRSFQKSDGQFASELENAFDIQEPSHDSNGNDGNGEEAAFNIGAHKDSNVSVLYSLIEQFQGDNIRVGINAPVLTVKYEILDPDTIPKTKGFKRKLKNKMELWENDSNGIHLTAYMRVNQEKAIRIDYENQLPVIDLIEEVSQFRKGHLRLDLMDTNELALAYMVRKSYNLDQYQSTAIIYIEPDFSRVVFLKGKYVDYITPIIHKGSISKDVLDVIYSKIIFAQDQQFIPELDKIVLASRSVKLKAREYFQEKFPSAAIGYVNSKLIGFGERVDDTGRVFSQYAIPIAFAWKLLQKKSIFTKFTNLLPEYILDRQKLPKLAYHGYILLVLLGITAFTFTWLLITKNFQIRKINHKIDLISSQMEFNKPLVEKVKYFDEEIQVLDKNIALVDSFSQGYDETLEFLKRLNESIQEQRLIWLKELHIKDKHITISGLAVSRDKIPMLSNALGGANLKKVTRADYLDKKVYAFELEKRLDESESTHNATLMSVLQNNKFRRKKTAVASNGAFTSQRQETN
ncbi:MAG: PilN domain-containing protein [bacterium]